MAYQVLARKWRPQQFDEVVGQKGVTQTLRNAISSGRIAQAFVFAGARGVGKTTTARILARSLNCEHGPTADPCGRCDSCIEIAEGRDLDVLEIDAATHTGVDNVRDVIIDGLAIRPVRDRYKIFIIDEVHQLSNSSFNALLKSMEEPPPHVVFMMATTELHKIPDTILSRAQVYEFRTIGTRAIADQLRRIADAEKIDADDAALMLVARAAEGSMRDAQSAFDQVLAFGTDRIDVDQVSMVLGLVARDLLLDIVDTVAREDAPAVFDLAARVIESGQDLKHVCRELARLVRDLMVLQVDPARAQDPEYAPEGDRDRLTALASAFSREDLLRAFDLIAKVEGDLRFATQPRYHLEMALLRWIHLRRLLPITDLIDAVQKNAPLPTRGASTLTPASASSSGFGGSGTRAGSTGSLGSGSSASLAAKVEAKTVARPSAAAPAPSPAAASTAASPVPTSAPAAERVPAPASAVDRAMPPDFAPPPERPSPRTSKPAASTAPASSAAAPVAPVVTGLLAGDVSPAALEAFKTAYLAELKRSLPKFLYNTTIASARRVDVTPSAVTFVFGVRPTALASQFEQQRPTLAELASAVAGRPMTIAAVENGEAAAPDAAKKPAQNAEQERLKASVLEEPAVQAMLDVFPAEIRDVEEM